MTKILKWQLYACYALIALMAVLFETDTVPEGTFSGDLYAGHRLLTQMWMVVAALFGIPIALKLFSLNYVKSRLTADESRASREMLVWGTLRIALLALPMVADMLCYYLFGADTAFFYLAVIEALAICFIWPSQQRTDSKK